MESLVEIERSFIKAVYVRNLFNKIGLILMLGENLLDAASREDAKEIIELKRMILVPLTYFFDYINPNIPRCLSRCSSFKEYTGSSLLIQSVTRIWQEAIPFLKPRYMNILDEISKNRENTILTPFLISNIEEIIKFQPKINNLHDAIDIRIQEIFTRKEIHRIDQGLA